jgi:signal peptide peptidase SppA
MDKSTHNLKCFMSHLGVYAVEPVAFQQLKSLVMSGNLVIEANQGGVPVGELETVQTKAGTLVIPISGMTMRNASSLGGTSTSMVRKVIRAAVNDKDVKAILLHIDSPGGHVDGTDALAQEVVKAAAVMPVHAHVDGNMASAAYWIGSGATKISASRMSTIGSLGTMLTVHDFSEKFRKDGIKTMTFATGKYKGLGEPGSEITKDQQAFLQRRVDEINAFFIDAVATGRGMDKETTEALFDGGFELAGKALKNGLIDAVQSFEESLAEIEALTGENKEGDDNAALARIRLLKHKRS